MLEKLTQKPERTVIDDFNEKNEIIKILDVVDYVQNKGVSKIQEGQEIRILNL